VKFETVQLVRPFPGERYAGDLAVVRSLDDGLLAALVDVSGHGPKAHELACTLANEIMNWPSRNLTGLMNRLHESARGTPGAAAGLALLDGVRGTLRYLGVGNTCIRRFGSQAWQGLSRDGLIGSRLPAPREETANLVEGDVITLYSDGLKEHFRQADYPRITLDTPSRIAETLMRRFGKVHDDASCLVIKCRP
jgi:hypothetical protein